MARYNTVKRLVHSFLGKKKPHYNKGFAYIELIAGMGVFLVIITAFLVMYRFSAMNRSIANEISTMATVAQNMAEVYKSTPGSTTELENAVIKEAEYEGFVKSRITVKQEAGIPKMYMTTVTITIKPRIASAALEDFVLVFFALDKNKIRGD